MKIDFDSFADAPRANRAPTGAQVRGETEPLAHVLLCAPSYLEPVPCCSVTRESLRNGFTTSQSAARVQHQALRRALGTAGAVCHELPPVPGLPDLAFTRDVAVWPRWGLVAPNPARPPRAGVVDHVIDWARVHVDRPVERITAGRIEGGDICIARPGLLIVGVSGTRTDDAGTEAFSRRFAAEGWKVCVCRFDEHFLHLDTIFCMLDETRALACVEALDDVFLEEVAGHGIELLGVSYKESRRLGCNVLSLDGRHVVAGTGTPRVTAMLRANGFAVTEVDIDQFTACGGGIHCLTMPLARGDAASTLQRQATVCAGDALD